MITACLLLLFSGWKQESQINTSYSGRHSQRRRIVSKMLFLVCHSHLRYVFESKNTDYSKSVCFFCRLAPYRGWFPVICSLCCSNFVYFYCYHCLKASLLKGRPSSSSTDLITGIAAGETPADQILKNTPLHLILESQFEFPHTTWCTHRAL